VPPRKPHWKDEEPSPTPIPTPTPTPTPAPTGALKHARPSLVDPIVWYPVPTPNRALQWSPTWPLDRDVLIRLPTDRPLTNGLGLVGGRNRLLVGGHIDCPRDAPGTAIDDPEWRCGIKARNSVGVTHVEGVLITNATDTFNIDIRQQSAVVQIQVCRFECAQEEAVVFHADVVQTWAGPGRLLIDRLTGIATFQGLMLSPNQSYGGFCQIDLSRINIDHIGPGGSYCYMRTHNGDLEKKLSSIVGSEIYGTNPATGRVVFTEYASFPSVTTGKPPNGDFVTREMVGLGYPRV
jgi:hypothetical protein